MSKDKGQKSQKKSPEDKSLGKVKSASSYKNEGKVTETKNVLEASRPKPGGKSSSTSKA